MMLRKLHTLAFILGVVGFGNTEDTTRWYYGMRSLFVDCQSLSRNNTNYKILESVQNCIKYRALVTLDSILRDNVIPLFDGIDLVKYNSYNSTDYKSDTNFTKNLPKNITTWSVEAFNRLINVLRSHVIKIDIDQLTNSVGVDINQPASNKSNNFIHARRRRHRRRRHQMMPLMMLGLMLMGSVLIPLGFQFLAVLGGKALLLAKMALILSSIQGLKKIATNGVNYGLYNAPVAETWHDRSSQEIQAKQLESYS